MSYLVYGFILLVSILMIVANIAVKKFFALKLKQQQEEEMAVNNPAPLNEQDQKAKVEKVDKLLDEILEARRNGMH